MTKIDWSWIRVLKICGRLGPQDSRVQLALNLGWTLADPKSDLSQPEWRVSCSENVFFWRM